MASYKPGPGGFQSSSQYCYQVGEVSFSSGYSYPNYSGTYYPGTYIPNAYTNSVTDLPYIVSGISGMGMGGIAGNTFGIGGNITSGTICKWPEPRIEKYEESYSQRKSANFYNMTLRGALKQSNEPRFDTMKIKPGEMIVEHAAFCTPRGQYLKTGADTNMDLCGQLGMPLYAVWHQIRVHLERYTGIDDAIRWKENTSIELMVNSKAIWSGSIGSMLPILPKGGYNKIDEKIKTGVIRFWPWYEAQLDQVIIEPTDNFTVRLRYKEPINPVHPMSIKVSLGPYLYRPVM